MTKLLLIVLTLIILVIGGYFLISAWKNNQDKDPKPLTLTVWGIKDDEQIMANVILGFKKLHPNVTVNYIPQNPLSYRTRTQTQILSNQGPDILALHNTWTPMLLQSGVLAAAPAEILNSGDFGRLFYKVASESLVVGGKVYGIPSEIDGLALFYNEDILKGQGVGVPKSWDEVVQSAAKLKVVEQSGKLTTGGLGMGSTSNVDNWSEIIGLLFFQQPNITIDKPNAAGGTEVVSFFKNPAQDPKIKVWDETMPNSTKAFGDGKLAFYLGPSYRAKQIREQNPNLHFTVIPVPQLPDKTVSFACFWGYGVSSKSKNQTAAWEFLKFLTDKATEQYIFEQEKSLHSLGRPYARVDLQQDLIKDKYLGAFVSQGPIYKSYPLCSETGDDGLNDEMIKAFKAGVDTRDLTTLQNTIPTILNKFTAPLPK